MKFTYKQITHIFLMMIALTGVSNGLMHARAHFRYYCLLDRVDESLLYPNGKKPFISHFGPTGPEGSGLHPHIDYALDGRVGLSFIAFNLDEVDLEMTLAEFKKLIETKYGIPVGIQSFHWGSKYQFPYVKDEDKIKDMAMNLARGRECCIRLQLPADADERAQVLKDIKYDLLRVAVTLDFMSQAALISDVKSSDKAEQKDSKSSVDKKDEGDKKDKELTELEKLLSDLSKVRVHEPVSMLSSSSSSAALLENPKS